MHLHTARVGVFVPVGERRQMRLQLIHSIQIDGHHTVWMQLRFVLAIVILHTLFLKNSKYSN